MRQENNNALKNGFTLVEMLLTVGMITLVTGISIPVYQSFQNRNDLDVAATSVVQNLRRAQLLSQAVGGDTTWGINVQSGSITLFQGTSYAGRDTNFDEVTSVPTSVAPQGTQEYVFAKLTGEPQATGSLSLTANTNETRVIIINNKGAISW